MAATRSDAAPTVVGIGLARPSGHGGQEDDRVVRSDRRREAVAIANVAIVDVDVDELRKLTFLGDPVAQGGMPGEEIVQCLCHGTAADFDAAVSAGVLAQDGGNANGAHAPAATRASGSTVRATPSPQAGQAGSRQIRTSSKVVPSASNISSRPARVSPTPSTSFRTSLAWSMPTIPGRTPSTPATLQPGASSSGGWVGYMQR